MEPHIPILFTSAVSPHTELWSEQPNLTLGLIGFGPGRSAAMSTKVFIQIAAGEDEEKTFARRGCRLAFWTK